MSLIDEIRRAQVRAGEDVVVAHLERTLGGLKNDENPSPVVPQAPVVGLKTYDPNIRWAVHIVEITYQMWEYSTTAQVTVTGNCKGESILQSAIGVHADEIYEQQGDNAELILRRPAEDGDGEDTLTTSPDDDDIESWLESMCVGLKIVAHTAEVKS